MSSSSGSQDNAHSQRSQKPLPQLGVFLTKWKEVCPRDTEIYKQIAGRRKYSGDWSFNLVSHVDNCFSFSLMRHNPLWQWRAFLIYQRGMQKCFITRWQGLKSKPSLPSRKGEPVFWLLNVWALGFNEPKIIVKENRAFLWREQEYTSISGPKGWLGVLGWGLEAREKPSEHLEGRWEGALDPQFVIGVSNGLFTLGTLQN